MLHNKYDFIIIGAGIIGCLIARSLARYKLNILIIEKESDIGMGASSANTAIIHASYNPVPGLSVMAAMWWLSVMRSKKAWKTCAKGL
jgi:L-2-hydroxyglutarate oxidase LhgO